MSALSPPASAALAAVLIGSVARSFLGRPARRPRRGAARALLAGTAVCYLGGAVMVVWSGAALPGALVVMAGIESSCLGAWLARGADDGHGDDGADAERVGPDPWDWDAFDRARERWARGPGRRPART